MIKTKVRGIRKKIKQFESNLIQATSSFPNEDDIGCGYWHLHLPIPKKFVDSSKTPISLRRQVVQLILERVNHLISIKPNLKESTRVVAALTLPNLFDSQIIVFFGNDYYENFFKRESADQKWILLSAKSNLIFEFSLENEIPLIGYKEIITGENYYHEGEIWFAGELK